MTLKELLAEENAVKIGDGGWFALDATPPDAVAYDFRAAAEVFRPWDGYVMTSTAVKKLLRMAQDAINDRFKVVKAELLAGEEVHIGTGRNFHNGLNLGRLVPREHKPRRGRNPHTGEKIDIPAANVVKFLTSKNLKAAINNAADGNAE